MDFHVCIEELQPCIHIHPIVAYAPIKTLCMKDRKACGFFDLLKVDMFLNPTDIEPAQAATNKSLLYTLEGEVLADFHVLPQMNPFYILLNAGYPMIFYWENCAMRFVLIVC